MLPKDVAEALPKGIDCSADSLCRWMVSREGLSVTPVYKYISYLKQLLEIALATAEIYDLRSGANALGRKEHLRHIGPHELMYIVNQLYICDSFGIQGGVLECGVSHGYSTCVLSHACTHLGRKLYAADSFQGLPPTRPDESFFREGDYAASLQIVQQNIAHLGSPSSVEYIEGFYSKSLEAFNKDVCILWLDVDLYESARDVMGHVFEHLDRRGAIFTHEFTDFYDQVHPRDALTPPNAIYDKLDSCHVKYDSARLMRYFGIIGFESTVQFDACVLLPKILDELGKCDGRWRQYQELRDCRTVRSAFAAKRFVDKFFRMRKSEP